MKKRKRKRKRKRKSRAEIIYDRLRKKNRVYEVPKILAQQISEEIQKVSSAAHKEYLRQQHQAYCETEGKIIVWRNVFFVVVFYRVNENKSPSKIIILLGGFFICFKNVNLL